MASRTLLLVLPLITILAAVLETCTTQSCNGYKDPPYSFIGLSIQKRATQATYANLKRNARSLTGNWRGKRDTYTRRQYSSSNSVRTSNNCRSQATSVQELFYRINVDFSLANGLRNTMARLDPLFERMIVVRRNGVGCQDVCTRSSNGYGTIGICTSTYCRCDWSRNSFQQQRCRDGLIFDPLTRRCTKARNTQLCSDSGGQSNTASSRNGVTSRLRPSSPRVVSRRTVRRKTTIKAIG